MCNSLFLLITLVTGLFNGSSSAEPDEEHQQIEVTNYIPNRVDKNIQQRQFQGLPAIVKDLLPCKCNPRIISTVCAGNENFKNQCYLSCVNAVRRRLNQSEPKVVCFASCDICQTSSVAVVKLEQNETHPPFFETKERFQAKHLSETRSLLLKPEEFQNRPINSKPIKTDIENDEQQQPIEPVPEIIRDLIPCRCNRHITNPVCAGDKNFQNRCYLACDNAVRRRLKQPELKNVCFASCDTCKSLKTSSLIKIEQNQHINEERKPEFNKNVEQNSLNPFTQPRHPLSNPVELQNHPIRFSPPTAEVNKVSLQEKIQKVPDNVRDLLPCRCNRQITNPICAGDKNFQNRCYLACENAVRRRLNRPEIKTVCFATCDSCKALDNIQQNITKAASIKPEKTQRKPYMTPEVEELKSRQATNTSMINQQRRLFTLKLSEVLLEEGVPTNMNDLVPCKCNRLVINPLCAGEVNFKNQCYLACENAVRSRMDIEQLNVTCYAKCNVCDAIGPHTSSIEM